jgi:hypothetical protein
MKPALKLAVISLATLAINTSGAFACNDDAASAMWDMANAMMCPGIWSSTGVTGVEPFFHMTARVRCEDRRNELYEKAKAMACGANKPSAKSAPKATFYDLDEKGNCIGN